MKKRGAGDGDCHGCVGSFFFFVECVGSECCGKELNKYVVLNV